MTFFHGKRDALQKRRYLSDVGVVRIPISTIWTYTVESARPPEDAHVVASCETPVTSRSLQSHRCSLVSFRIVFLLILNTQLFFYISWENLICVTNLLFGGKEIIWLILLWFIVRTFLSHFCIWIISIEIYLTFHRNLTGTTTPSWSGPGSNGKEGVLYTSKSSRARASPSDTVQYYTQDG